MDELNQYTYESTMPSAIDWKEIAGWSKIYQFDYDDWELNDVDCLSADEIAMLTRDYFTVMKEVVLLKYVFRYDITTNSPAFLLDVYYKEEKLTLSFMENKKNKDTYILEPFFTYFLPSGDVEYLNTLMWMFLAVSHCPLTLHELEFFPETFTSWLPNREIVGFPNHWNPHKITFNEEVLHW